MSDSDLFADWPDTHTRCESDGHALSANGCDGKQPGTHVVAIIHTLGSCNILSLPPAGILVIVCQSKAAYYQGRRDNTVACPSCQRLYCSSDVYEVRGELRTITPKKGTP